MYTAIERAICTFLLLAAVLALLFLHPSTEQAATIAAAIIGVLAAYLAQKRRPPDP